MRSTIPMTLKCAVAVGVFAATGCTPPPPPPPPPAPVVWKIPSGRRNQVMQLTQASNQLDVHVAALPGKNAFDHRKVMSAALTELGRAIALAAGDQPSFDILNRLTVINHAASVVSEVDAPPKRLAAAENEGIVAALGGLQLLATHPATPDTALMNALDDAEAKLGSLRMTEGPLHELDATQTLQSLAKSVQLLASAFDGNTAMAAMP